MKPCKYSENAYINCHVE